MTRIIDTRQREEQILKLIITSYIEGSKPVSSTYLCQQHNLPYSSATIRHVMESLEQQGLLCHLHTSSGRVPTKRAFKWYVEHFTDEDISALEWEQELPCDDLDKVFEYSLQLLAQNTGYASLVALSGRDERFMFTGVHSILDCPEFTDIKRLRDLLYTLEVKISQLQEVLLHQLSDRVTILIGEEIGFEEIADCSLVISGARDSDFAFALALLGPVRMDYLRAASYINSVTQCLQEKVKELV